MKKGLVIFLIVFRRRNWHCYERGLRFYLSGLSRFFAKRDLIAVPLRIVIRSSSGASGQSSGGTPSRCSGTSASLVNGSQRKASKE